MSGSSSQRQRVLGVEVDRTTVDDLVVRVSESVRSGERLLMAGHNMHSAYLYLEDAEMRRWYEMADLVFVDGMSLVLASQLSSRRLRREHRATVLDWMPQVLDAAARDGTRVFHLGGDPEWVKRGADEWRQHHPGLQLDVHHGYFHDEESAEVVSVINDVRPDLLLIGMGMPRQEHWAARHATDLSAPVIVTVGAFLVYATGAAVAPPRWTGKVGLEWAWRLAADPRRLAHRYLVEPFALSRALYRVRRPR